jgi:hypothetical protein
MRNRLEILVPQANRLFRRYSRTWEDVIKIKHRRVSYESGDLSCIKTAFNGKHEIKLSSSTKVANFFRGSPKAKFPRKPEHHLVTKTKKNVSGLRKEPPLSAFVPRYFAVMTDQRQPLRIQTEPSATCCCNVCIRVAKLASPTFGTLTSRYSYVWMSII